MPPVSNVTALPTTRGRCRLTAVGVVAHDDQARRVVAPCATPANAPMPSCSICSGPSASAVTCSRSDAMSCARAAASRGELVGAGVGEISRPVGRFGDAQGAPAGSAASSGPIRMRRSNGSSLTSCLRSVRAENEAVHDGPRLFGRSEVERFVEEPGQRSADTVCSGRIRERLRCARRRRRSRRQARARPRRPGGRRALRWGGARPCARSPGPLPPRQRAGRAVPRVPCLGTQRRSAAPSRCPGGRRRAHLPRRIQLFALERRPACGRRCYPNLFLRCFQKALRRF